MVIWIWRELPIPNCFSCLEPCRIRSALSRIVSSSAKPSPVENQTSSQQPGLSLIARYDFSQFSSEKLAVPRRRSITKGSLSGSSDALQRSPKPKSYTFPSESVQGVISCGTSSLWHSTSSIEAGNCIGRRPVGSREPDTSSIKALLRTPKATRIASAKGSNSITTGRVVCSSTTTGFPPIAALVSRTRPRSVSFSTRMVFPR